jgi:hypothetical protein
MGAASINKHGFISFGKVVRAFNEPQPCWLVRREVSRWGWEGNQRMVESRRSFEANYCEGIHDGRGSIPAGRTE